MVLVVNARSYSAADIFAAGFQDNRLGVIVGTDRRTGAGGANVVEHSELLAVTRQIRDRSMPGGIGGEEGAGALGFAELPASGDPRVQRQRTGPVGMSVAIRRSLRVGENAGRPLEDLGVETDVVHRLTTRDVLENNVDLKRRAAALLRRESHLLTARWGPRTGSEWTVEVDAHGIEDFELSLLETGGLGADETLPWTDKLLGREVSFTREEATREDAGENAFRLVIHNVPARRGYTGVWIRGLAGTEPGTGADRRVVAGWVLQVPQTVEGLDRRPVAPTPVRGENRHPGVTPSRRPAVITPSRERVAITPVRQ